MPKFTFDCSCGLRFTRSLKMGEHPQHLCPGCGEEAPRYWEGQSVSHAFAHEGQPTNSGVSKHDHPSADQAIGHSADERWAEIAERERVKKQVRELGGTEKLIRRNAPENKETGGSSYIEYTAASPKLVEARKALVKGAEARSWGASEKATPSR